MEVNPRMPNAKVLSEKQAIVADLTNKLQNEIGRASCRERV